MLCSRQLIQDLGHRQDLDAWKLISHPLVAGGQRVPKRAKSPPPTHKDSQQGPHHPAIPESHAAGTALTCSVCDQGQNHAASPRHKPHRGKPVRTPSCCRQAASSCLCQTLPVPHSWEGEPAIPQVPGCLISLSSVPQAGQRSCPLLPCLPSAELGLLSSVCSFSSFSRFSEAHAPDSSCCRIVGQNSLNSLCPTVEPSLRLWMAKSSTELKHWGKKRQAHASRLLQLRKETLAVCRAPDLPGRGSSSAAAVGRHWRAPLPHPGGSAGPLAASGSEFHSRRTAGGDPAGRRLQRAPVPLHPCPPRPAGRGEGRAALAGSSPGGLCWGSWCLRDAGRETMCCH